MKVVAIFDVDKEKLDEIENGLIENAFAWCQDSGVYLEEYETYSDDELLPKIDK